jgi:hypothetical protein
LIDGKISQEIFAAGRDVLKDHEYVTERKKQSGQATKTGIILF